MAEAEKRLILAKKEAMRLTEKRADEEVKRKGVLERERVQVLADRKKQRELLTQRINAQVLASVESEDDEELIKLLEGGADVNVQNSLKRTPLTLAVMKASPSLVRILLSYRADVNIPDLYGQTPLSFAIKYKRHACFELMAHGQRATPEVGAFMYQRKLEATVEVHRLAMEIRKEEKEREELLYASSKKKKKK